MVSKLRSRYLRWLYYFSSRAATRYLKHYNLLEDIYRLQKKHSSTGVGLIHYACLHDYVRRNKPQYFLECGTGISTHIIAKGMKDYSYQNYETIKLVSMESEEKWYDISMKLYPEEYKDFLDIILSPVDFYQYAFVRGVRYKEVPSFPYDCVFVDGPDPHGMCDMDFICLVQSSNRPVLAIIDSRKTTILAYSCLFGKHKIKYYHFGLSFVGPVTKEDFIHNSSSELKEIFQKNIKEYRGSHIESFLESILWSLLPTTFSKWSLARSLFRSQI